MTGIRTRRTPPAGLGTMLAEARTRRGYGLRQTARLAGIPHPHLWRLERGERVPSRSVAELLAQVLALDESERAELFAAAVVDGGRDAPGRRRPGSPIGTRGSAHGHQSAAHKQNYEL